MNAEKFSDAMSDLNTKYVDEAVNYRKESKKSVWVKWGAVAACVGLLVVLGVFSGRVFGGQTDTSILDDGGEIVFAKSEITASSIDFGVNVTTRQLTEEEIAALFPGLPVTAYVIFSDNEEVLGFEGNIGSIEMAISTTSMSLPDTEIIGSEGISNVDGTSVTAGYFVTGRNSFGEQSAIYFAAFGLGDCTIYLENAGAKTESETVKNDLAAIIQDLINNGEPNLAVFNR